MLSVSIATQLKAGLCQVRDEINGLKEMLALRRRETITCELKYELAASALIRQAYVSQKAGFRRDQPRQPKGTAEGGQWSGGAGTEPPSTEPSENPKSRGHHLVPGKLYRSEPLQPETRRVFEQATTGPLYGDPHGYDKPHTTLL
jgi:hypothetical protein